MAQFVLNIACNISILNNYMDPKHDVYTRLIAMTLYDMVFIPY